MAPRSCAFCRAHVCSTEDKGGGDLQESVQGTQVSGRSIVELVEPRVVP